MKPKSDSLRAISTSVFSVRACMSSVIGIEGGTGSDAGHGTSGESGEVGALK